ncbi:CidA/LrgA family protein [Hominifimenecus sp. rT4P-3]|uniref:CidA/LrgA family protein n=1 Tax=Hominifimenecus sp. rT4P-3 TaxID=3242979 RepID=UPI003DA691D9
MKYLKQFGIILIISFLGEVFNYVLPFPIPASIYGLILLFLCLHFGLFPIEAVKETAYFLIEIMPLMFIPAAVGLITSWGIIQSNLLAYIFITVLSTFFVMIVSGHITQFTIRHGKKEGNL